MDGAATIVIARDDLSIPDGPEQGPQLRRAVDVQKHFFDLVRARHPDVIVLDCRGPRPNGVQAIHKIRQRVDTPILVVCSAADECQTDYRVAGASDCLYGPFDLEVFHQGIQNIIRVNGGAVQSSLWRSGAFEVAGLLFEPQQNELSGKGGALKLTTAESRLLMHLVKRPWTVCSRAEIASMIYGAYGAAGDRAVDVVVTRLRKKLAQLRGEHAAHVIRTEYRQGYMFVGEPAVARASVAGEPVAGLVAAQ